MKDKEPWPGDVMTPEELASRISACRSGIWISAQLIRDNVNRLDARALTEGMRWRYNIETWEPLTERDYDFASTCAQRLRRDFRHIATCAEHALRYLDNLDAAIEARRTGGQPWWTM